MRYQQTAVSCGACAIVNALKCLGKSVAERNIRAQAKTDNEGTDENGVCDAVRAMGFSATKYETPDKKAAWGWLADCLRSGKPVIMCVENWHHWVTAIGIIGDTIIIADPGNTVGNKKENGILTFSKSIVIKKWKHSREGAYFGIAVSKK